MRLNTGQHAPGQTKCVTVGMRDDGKEKIAIALEYSERWSLTK